MFPSTKQNTVSIASLTREFGLRLANGQPLSKIMVKTNKRSSSAFSTSSQMTKKQYTSTILVSPPAEMSFLFYDL